MSLLPAATDCVQDGAAASPELDLDGDADMTPVESKSAKVRIGLLHVAPTVFPAEARCQKLARVVGASRRCRVRATVLRSGVYACRVGSATAAQQVGPAGETVRSRRRIRFLGRVQQSTCRAKICSAAGAAAAEARCIGEGASSVAECQRCRRTASHQEEAVQTALSFLWAVAEWPLQDSLRSHPVPSRKGSCTARVTSARSRASRSAGHVSGRGRRRI